MGYRAPYSADKLVARTLEMERKKKQQCAYCDRGFFAIQELQRHISSVHERKKQQRENSTSTLQSKDSPKEISKCEVEFKKKLGRQEQRNNCTICNLQFPKSTNLSVHNAIVHSMFVILRDIRN